MTALAPRPAGDGSRRGMPGGVGMVGVGVDDLGRVLVHVARRGDDFEVALRPADADDIADALADGGVAGAAGLRVRAAANVATLTILADSPFMVEVDAGHGRALASDLRQAAATARQVCELLADVADLLSPGDR